MEKMLELTIAQTKDRGFEISGIRYVAFLSNPGGEPRKIRVTRSLVELSLNLGGLVNDWATVEASLIAHGAWKGQIDNSALNSF